MRRSTPDERLTPARQLQKRIDDQLQEYGGGFVRLSRRSPKDAISEVPALRERAKASLRAALSELGSNPSPPEEALALFHAMGSALQVFSGEEAVQMMTHSERAFVDLLLALDFQQAWSVHAAVRKWTPMPIEAEFRCATDAQDRLHNPCIFGYCAICTQSNALTL